MYTKNRRRVLTCAHCLYQTSVALTDDTVSTWNGTSIPAELSSTDYEHIDIQEWDYEIHLSLEHRVSRPNQLDVPERVLVNG